MEVSRPLYAIGIKDKPFEDFKNFSKDDIVKKHIAIEILLNLIFGESSDLYKKLYNDGVIMSNPSMVYLSLAEDMLLSYYLVNQKILERFMRSLKRL